jgi:hypothetical protein
MRPRKPVRPNTFTDCLQNLAEMRQCPPVPPLAHWRFRRDPSRAAAGKAHQEAADGPSDATAKLAVASDDSRSSAQLGHLPLDGAAEASLRTPAPALQSGQLGHSATAEFAVASGRRIKWQSHLPRRCFGPYPSATLHVCARRVCESSASDRCQRWSSFQCRARPTFLECQQRFKHGHQKPGCRFLRDTRPAPWPLPAPAGDAPFAADAVPQA